MNGQLTALILALAGVDGPPTPEESRAALRLADPSLTIELVASEPEVADPVAIAWDEFGRLYVAEMTDYPVAPPGGRIKLLEDRDGDGRYERAVVFAEGLPYPSGVLPWSGGLLVTAAPDLLFLKDADGDGRSEVRRVVLTGFAEGNQQLRVNSPTWGRDNWVYLANGRSGGAVRRPDDPPESAVPIPRSDLRVRPDTGEFEPVAGFSQFGLPRDDWGDRFPSWNTVPLRHVVLEGQGPSGVAEILDLSDGGRIYSLSPEQRRFNAESVAFFNATCGPTIERGGLLGEAYLGDAFVCEPLSSVVHHRRLVADGTTFEARRVEQGREFLASEHSWFRPVNLANGPDGALYVVDFCRAWIEHPAFVPEDLRGEVDFREGHDRGRIWRIARRGAVRSRPVRPGDLATADLIAELANPVGWRRDTAQRLLVERRGAAAVAALRDVARTGPAPLPRVHALWALDGLDALDIDTLRHALTDPEPRVREAAARLAAARDGLMPELSRLAEDDDVRVRLRAAVALGNREGNEAREALASLAARAAGSRWMTLAILGGVGDEPLKFLESLVGHAPSWQDEPDPDQARFLTTLAERIGENNKDSDVELLMRRIDATPGRPAAFALLLGLARGQESLAEPRMNWTDPPREVARVRDSALATAADASRPAWHRVLALETALATRAPGVGERLLALLDPDEPKEVQALAARGVARFSTPEQADRLLEGWDRSPLSTRRLLLAALATREPLADRLLDALESGAVAPNELDPTTREALLALGGGRLRERVEAVLRAEPSVDRGEVVRRFEPALSLEPDPERGRDLFARHCQTCHARDGRGARVGPDLIGLVGRPPADLLTSILDPSREVAPDGLGIVVASHDGQLRTGLLVEETPATIRLRRPDGPDEVLPRAEVEALRPTGRSLMPDGFEQVLGPQGLADLIAYLRRPEPIEAGPDPAP